MSTEPQKQGNPPTYEQLVEGHAVKDLYQAMRKWREAGKPHKR